MQEKVKQISISNSTKQKVQAAKSYIQQRYSKLLQQEQQKKQYWDQLNRKMQMLNISSLEQQKIKNKILHEQASVLRQDRIKLSIKDFPSVKIVGKGAFGQVRLCKSGSNSQPVAVKKLKKAQMIFKNKVIQSRQERNILAISQKNPWIVGLKCSFQDEDNLYLVMEYLPGGDLMNLLIKKDIFTHEQAQFYTAQMLMALDSVHKMKYIHRDLKPDNVLVDADGHIKLSDFGLCKHTEIRPKKLTDSINKKNEQILFLKKNTHNRQGNKRNRRLAYTAVGTPDYVAPQVQGKMGYTETVDWWSMGVILFEMLVGYPPFASETTQQTWHKIQNWRKYLVIPKDVDVSPQAADLIRKLINDPKERLGSNGVQEIKAHPFFSGVNWSKLRNKKSPYIPELKNSWDTTNFDAFEEQQDWIPSQTTIKQKKKKKNVPQFIGYTYKPIQDSNSILLKALVDLDNYKGQRSQPVENKKLEYLHLEGISTEGENSTRFMKKDKTERIKKQYFATTTMLNKKKEREEVQNGLYFIEKEKKQKKALLKKEIQKEKEEKKVKMKLVQKKFG